jgi:hypothetical protein
MSSGKYWCVTIKEADFTPELLDGLSWIKGQLEEGEGGFRHYQIVCYSIKKSRMPAIKSIFGNSAHVELSRSAAATNYVWKDDTAIPDTRFEFGAVPRQRNNPEHWNQVWELAKTGDMESIPADIRVPHYRTLRAISADYAQPVAVERICMVFWGDTGTGKSRRAWEEAGLDAYPKDPRTKFWCGYGGQENVVIDEFRGGIDIGHMLRWLDRYPVIVEIKGASVVLRATKIWITSNLEPSRWYPELDPTTYAALARRMAITEIN